MASTLDVLPTVAAITGAPLPRAPIDGVSLLPALEGRSESPRTRFHFYYGGELRAVREGKWKRVFEHRTRSYVGLEPGRDGVPGPYAFPVVPGALYDLEGDVGETTDVSAGNPEVVARLDSLAEEIRERLGDRLQGRRGGEVRPPGRLRFDRPDTTSHAGVGARVTLGTAPSPLYSGEGAFSLTDGRLGTRDHHDGLWLGFSGQDLDALVDLGKATAIHRVGLDCLRSQGAWIFYPRWIDVRGSEDGERWLEMGRVEVPRERIEEPQSRIIEVSAPEGFPRVRFLRVRAGNHGPLPTWHPGAGEDAWLFVDEILVE
jgi:hypothetical protein